MLGASAKCRQAEAVIAMDPWFFPYSQELDAKCLDYQKCQIIMTENYPQEI